MVGIFECDFLVRCVQRKDSFDNVVSEFLNRVLNLDIIARALQSLKGILWILDFLN